MSVLNRTVYLDNKLRILNTLIGTPISMFTRKGEWNIGHIYWEYNRLHGGYRLQQVVDINGSATSDIEAKCFVTGRLTYQNMTMLIDTLICGIEIGKNKAKLFSILDDIYSIRQSNKGN